MMKTLNQHNADQRANLLSNIHRSGVACDVCGSEMIYLDPGVQLASYPPKMAVSCQNENCKDHNKIKYKVV